ncbi:CIS tube protein [Pseudochryseolinea flava]|uniref:LysM peptidoglycan-binding domain-containing protein n=1 Tax=Pseudochryseolinea flava TaxID=2059302 RepID=A0A364Y448_9BACT|nr:LysM peptidoglycan-binding domain-containing protein [Pseudochryseolinea flava]RAW01593.1 LysM peptidoglycan-binding domain-containing protein [Pseudochryseolinea flava]
MAAQDSGKLEKIRIETYADDKYKNKGSDEFVAMFNANKYTLKYEIEQNEKQGAGTSPSAPTFAKMKSQEIDLEFLLDGTGVTGEVVNVQTKVDEFLKAAYEFKGDKHKPRYLRVWWGNAFVFDCVLKSADVNYTLFRADGTPLRAKIAAKFAGFVNDELREKKEDKQSPDVAHVREVPPKERLDYLTFKEYEASEFYLQVAQFNGLNSFRKLKTGSTLIFPPIV